MPKFKSSTSFVLDELGIDGFSEWLSEELVSLRVEPQNRLRMRLTMEDILLQMYRNLDEGSTVSARLEMRPGRRRYRLTVEIPGKPHNPLNQVASEMGDWSSSLGAAIGMRPEYSHDNELNILRLRVPISPMNPVLKIMIAILLGILVGLLGKVLPGDWDVQLSEVLLEPTYMAWNRLLNAISAPIIFLTTLTTLLNARRIDEHGGNSLSVVLRYFALSILMVAVALLLSLPFFPLNYQDLMISPQIIRELLTNIIELIPPDIVDPFAKSNTQQLLVMAFVLGFILIKLRNWAEGLRQLAREANLVGLTLAQVVSWLVPFVTGAFLCLELWYNRYQTLLGLWIPLAISTAITVVILLGCAVVVARRRKVSPLLVLHKIWKPFVIALRTGSLDDSLSETQNSCVRLLGIDRGFTKVALPQGLVLYMPVSAIGTIVFTLFVARQFDVPTTGFWFIRAIVMAVVVFVATPPVPGANLLAYVVLFATLGIPSEALMDAMIFDIIFGILAGAANQAMLQLELITSADHFGLLDYDLLRAPMPRQSQA